MQRWNRITGWSLVALAPLLAMPVGCRRDAPGDEAARATTELAAPEAAVADYAVHEWGLVRVFPDGAEVASSGHSTGALASASQLREEQRLARLPSTPAAGSGSRPVRPGVDVLPPGGGDRPSGAPVTRKPLIYLHPGATWDAATEVSVSVRIPGGTFREVWPTPAAGPQPEHDDRWTWSGLRVGSTTCNGSVAPSLLDPACSSLTDGGICEAQEMALYMASSVPCITAGTGEQEVRTPALVYNGHLPPAFSSPLEIGADGSITNRSPHTVPVLWVNQGDAIVRVDGLAPGSTATLEGAPSRPMADLEGLTGELRATLAGLGLTQLEAEHFVDAWSPDVLAWPYPWRALGLLSDDAVAELLPLEATPTPTRIVRVHAFTHEQWPEGLNPRPALLAEPELLDVQRQLADARRANPGTPLAHIETFLAPYRTPQD